MTAVVTLAANAMQPAHRTPQRRGARDDGEAKIVFTFAHAKAEVAAEEPDIQEPENEAARKSNEVKEEKVAVVTLPLPPFLLAAQTTPRATNVEPHPSPSATPRLAANVAVHDALPRPSRPSHWLADDEETSPALEPPRKSATTVARQIHPDADLKPFAATTTQQPPKPAADRENDAKPIQLDVPRIEAAVVEAAGPHDTQLAPPHTLLQPQSPVVQLAVKLAPAINQAQAILAILVEAGDPGPVIKTLQFGLHPQDLGEVRVTLSLAPETLALRIETQNEDAARRLERDRGLLDTLLVQAGVAVERSQIDIRIGRFEAALPVAIQGSAAHGGDTFNSNGSQRDRHRPETSQQTESNDHAARSSSTPVERDRRGVYL